MAARIMPRAPTAVHARRRGAPAAVRQDGAEQRQRYGKMPHGSSESTANRERVRTRDNRREPDGGSLLAVPPDPVNTQDNRQKPDSGRTGKKKAPATARQRRVRLSRTRYSRQNGSLTPPKRQIRTNRVRPHGRFARIKCVAAARNCVSSPSTPFTWLNAKRNCLPTQKDLFHAHYSRPFGTRRCRTRQNYANSAYNCPGAPSLPREAPSSSREHPPPHASILLTRTPPSLRKSPSPPREAPSCPPRMASRMPHCAYRRACRHVCRATHIAAHVAVHVASSMPPRKSRRAPCQPRTGADRRHSIGTSHDVRRRKRGSNLPNPARMHYDGPNDEASKDGRLHYAG